MLLNKIDFKKKSFHPCVTVWVLYAFGGLVSSPDGHLSDPAAASAPSSPRAPRRPPPGGSLQPQKERTLRWAEIKGRQWATFVCNTARAIIAKLPGQPTKLQPEAKINCVEKVSVAAAVTRWHSMALDGQETSNYLATHTGGQIIFKMIARAQKQGKSKKKKKKNWHEKKIPSRRISFDKAKHFLWFPLSGLDLQLSLAWLQHWQDNKGRRRQHRLSLRADSAAVTFLFT